MPSFDIVSKTDLAEFDNAIANMQREMSQRYDFKGADCRIERSELEVMLNADDDLKLRQMHELLKGNLTQTMTQTQTHSLSVNKPSFHAIS